MKKIIYILLVFIAILAFTACNQTQTNTGFDIVVLETNTDNNFLLTQDIVDSYFKDSGFTYTYFNETLQQRKTKLQSMVETSLPKVIITNTINNQDSKEIIELAKNNNVCLIFYGLPVDSGLIKSYDKCWYIGAKPALIGEQLGEQVYKDFSSNVFSDKNNDNLIQYVYLTDNNQTNDIIYQSLITQIEHNGVFSNSIAIQQITKDNSINTVLQTLINENANIEMFICANDNIAAELQQYFNKNNISNDNAANIEIKTDLEETTDNSEEETSNDIAKDEISVFNYGIYILSHSNSSFDKIENDFISAISYINIDNLMQTIKTLSNNIITSSNPYHEIDFKPNKNKEIFMPVDIYTKDTINGYNFLSTKKE